MSQPFYQINLQSVLDALHITYDKIKLVSSSETQLRNNNKYFTKLIDSYLEELSENDNYEFSNVFFRVQGDIVHIGVCDNYDHIVDIVNKTCIGFLVKDLTPTY